MSEQNNTEMTFQIQRIYTKDISFEAPNAPHVFQKDWQPEVKLDLIRHLPNWQMTYTKWYCVLP